MSRASGSTKLARSRRKSRRRRHVVAHQRRPRTAVGLGRCGLGVGDGHALEDPGVGVEGGLGQLGHLHLAETLEPAPLDVLGLAVALGQLGGDGVALGVAERPVGLAPDLGGVQRRLGGEHPALVEHGPHVAVEQGEQQTADVAAVDVGVAEDDDAPVASQVDVELLARPRADGGEDRLGLGVVEHLLGGGLARVDDLAPDGQHGLGLGVAALLGRSGGRVALDDDELGVETVDPAVGQLVGHAGGAEVGRLALVLERLLGGDPVDDGVGQLVAHRVDVGLLAVAADPGREPDFTTS
jgi:hypothetical protein